ncbi:MAG: hypothetical protein HY897_10545, partial [Deltaproteobacteria bacterium]|nr:hypothetical protein [Deltaproteobacteria bacterium]
MNRRNAMLFGLVLACPAVATYLASCHCGPPADVGAPGAQRSAPVSSPEPRASASGARDGAEAVPPLGAPILRRASEGRRGGEGELRSFRSALTSSATSDTDFLTANRGYGIVEDTSVSAGNIRRTLGLPNFGLANVNPTVDGWQTTTALPVSRGAHAVVTSNGYACLVGGGNGAGLYQDVYCAMINADGTLKQWMQTTGIPGKRSGVSGIVHVGKMYFTGGADGTNYLDEVVYAPLNSDGTITQWFSTNSFPTRRYWHATVAYNGYLYVIGGTGSSGYLNSIEYAKIDAGGATGQWLAATSFSNAREALSAVVVNGYLYVLGGYNGSRLSDVQYAKINADGSLGSFASAGSFPTARFGHTSVAYDGRLYVLGGDVGGETNNVSFAQINADGTVGLWSTSVAFSSPRYAHATFVSTGFIYVVGGKAGSNYLSDVQFAPIRPDGHVGTTWVK